MELVADKPDDALSADVESAFNIYDFVVLEIRVLLPGECTTSGQALKFGQRHIIAPEDFNVTHPETVLPLELQRIMRLLVHSLRLR